MAAYNKPNKRNQQQLAPIVFPVSEIKDNSVYHIDAANMTLEERHRISLMWQKMLVQTGIKAYALIMPSNVDITELGTFQLQMMHKHIGAILKERGTLEPQSSGPSEVSGV